MNCMEELEKKKTRYFIADNESGEDQSTSKLVQDAKEYKLNNGLEIGNELRAVRKDLDEKDLPSNCTNIKLYEQILEKSESSVKRSLLLPQTIWSKTHTMSISTSTTPV